MARRFVWPNCYPMECFDTPAIFARSADLNRDGCRFAARERKTRVLCQRGEPVSSGPAAVAGPLERAEGHKLSSTTIFGRTDLPSAATQAEQRVAERSNLFRDAPSRDAGGRSLPITSASFMTALNRARPSGSAHRADSSTHKRRFHATGF